jgi:inner membrane transporter RhtA
MFIRFEHNQPQTAFHCAGASREAGRVTFEVTAPAPDTAPEAGAGGLGSGVAMVVAAMFSVQAGAALATQMFSRVGPAGMVFLRLGIAAVVLLAVARPSVRGLGRRDWMVAVGFGAILGTMNLAFYEAIQRLPLGIAVTIELLGPLCLAVALSRGWRQVAWAGLALAGVAMLGGRGGHLDPVGVAFVLVAAACWAGYILLSAETGRRFARVEGLALATAFAALVSAPFGLVSGGAALWWPSTLAVGVAVALLSSVFSYSLELTALRRLPARVFGVLMSLSPVAATLAGLVLLGQRLSPFQLVAVLCVIVASGATILGARTRPAT